MFRTLLVYFKRCIQIYIQFMGLSEKNLYKFFQQVYVFTCLFLLNFINVFSSPFLSRYCARCFILALLYYNLLVIMKWLTYQMFDLCGSIWLDLRVIYQILLKRVLFVIIVQFKFAIFVCRQSYLPRLEELLTMHLTLVASSTKL